MYKIRHTYKDYDDNERTEDFWFNLNEDELARLQYSKDGGFSNYSKRILDAGDERAKMEIFQQMIDLAYGQKSADGKGFYKSEEILRDFKATKAYSDIFMMLGTDDKKAAEFMNGIVPKNILEKAAANNKNLSIVK